ncbi:hypothetical protein ACW9KT_19680 [Hymenobacter sp. HD11105]
MTDPIQAMRQQTGQAPAPFPATSRYYGLATAQLETAPGEPLTYLRRRMIPPPERFFILQEHVVTAGERPDNLTTRYLGDPEQYWRLCDANGVVQPNELTDTIGRRLRITLPEGIPGYSHA